MPTELYSQRGVIIGACFVVGYLVFMLTNPARGSLRDGLRCLRRYPRLWSVLTVFGFSYAVFQLAVSGFLYTLLPEGAPGRPLFQLHRAWVFGPHALMDAMKAGLLPALEFVAGIFNSLVTTFPFSALAAALFLSNWGNHHAVLSRALRRRFGRAGLVLQLVVIICAIAALLKPALYGPLLLMLARSHSAELVLDASLGIDWLSFLFESLFGVCVQIYLILLAYVWVRGLNFTHEHLLDFAIRRFSVAMRWTLVIMALATAFIYLPLIFSALPATGDWLSAEGVFNFIHDWARPALALVLILFCTMQIDLVFHGETLQQALGNHAVFVVDNFRRVIGFLVAALLNAWLLAVLNQALLTAFGPSTLAGYLWNLFIPLLNAILGAWLLASWACLYLRAQRHMRENEALVRF